MAYSPLGINFDRNYRNSLNAQLKELFDRISNIIGQAGDSNTEIVDARLGVDGQARPTLGDFIRELQQDIIDLQAGGGTQEQIDTLALRVTAVENALVGKANVDDVNNLIDIVNSKANQSDLTNLSNTVTTHQADNVKHITNEERTKWNNGQLYRITDANGSAIDLGLNVDLNTITQTGIYRVGIANIPEIYAGTYMLQIYRGTQNSVIQVAIAENASQAITFTRAQNATGAWSSWKRTINSDEIMKGGGSPEGVIVAPIGTLYLRTDGGTSTTFYVKESGTGNTGWKAK